MKRIAILFLLLFLLPACSNGIDKEKVQEYADPMVENILQGMNEDNYEKFSKDFGPIMLDALNAENYDGIIKKQIKEIIGNYESKELAKVDKVSQGDEDYIVVIYKATFSKETSDVAVTVYFTEGEDPKIETLLFNSPKLVENAS